MILKTIGTVVRPEHAKEAGVRVLGMYADASGHTTYYILDADGVEKVGRFLFPLLTIGTAETIPVTDLTEEVKRKLAETKEDLRTKKEKYLPQ
ncbi:MAG: hypothetical protein FJ012_10280 [Chloroflexi bacterium]|nr:hypothetical protein [Chloroflexota bacterium]